MSSLRVMNIGMCQRMVACVIWIIQYASLILACVLILPTDDNDLFGTIPTQFGLLENLFNISLWNNQLDGTVPTELAKCTKLTEIRLCKF